MATGFQRASNRPRGREIAASQLAEFALEGAPEGRDWSRPYELPEGRERSVDELLERFGGTRGLAEVTGRSQRQVQRWKREGISAHARHSTRQALARANAAADKAERKEYAQREWGELLNRFGGVKGLAQAANVSERTARRWVSGQAIPSPANMIRLERADRHYRMASTYPHLGIDAQTHEPISPVYLRAAGHVTAKGPGKSPLYQYMRQIGIESVGGLGYEMPPDVATEMFDRLHAGDNEGALDALQKFLSEDYADFSEGDYSVEHGVGFFIDDLTEFNLN